MQFHSIFLDDENGSHDASNLYWACEVKCRRLIKRFLYYGCAHLSTFLPVLIFVIVDIVNGEFDGSAYNLPFNVVVPFNMESVLGWLLTWLYQFMESSTYNINMIITTTYIVCFCHYIIAMCKHFDQFCDSVRFDSQRIQVEKNSRNRQRMWLNAKGKLQRAIELHVNIYE